MEGNEEGELVVCLDCGEEVESGTDRAYPLSDESFLCFECAVKRGGCYDMDTDSWVTDPDVAEEPDDRRPHP